MRLLLLLLALVWNTDLYSQIPQLVVQKPHRSPITYLEYNKFNKLLYTESMDEKLIKVWNPRYGKLLKDIDLSFTNGNPYPFLANHGKSIIVFDNAGLHLLAANGDSISFRPLKDGDRNEYDQFSGNEIIIQKNGQIDLFNTTTGTNISLVSDPNPRYFASINPGGLFTYATFDHSFFYDLSTEKIIDSLHFINEHHLFANVPRTFMNEKKDEICLVRDKQMCFLKTRSHDTVQKIELNHEVPIGSSTLYLTPNFEKAILFGYDSVYITNLKSGIEEAKFPGNLFVSRIDSIAPHCIQIQSIGKDFILDWAADRILQSSTQTLDGVTHLNGKSNKYVVDKPGKTSFSFQKDSIFSVNLQNPAIRHKNRLTFKTTIQSITSDDEGTLYISGNDMNDNYVIQVADENTLQYRSSIPDVTGLTYQYSAISQPDSSGFMTSGYGMNSKRWNLNDGSVKVISNSSGSLIQGRNYYITQSLEDTGRDILTMHSSLSGKIIKQILTPLFSLQDFFREGIEFGGSFYLPTNFSSDFYKWDTALNTIVPIPTGIPTTPIRVSPLSATLIAAQPYSPGGTLAVIDPNVRSVKANTINADLIAAAGDNRFAQIRSVENSNYDLPKRYFLEISRKPNDEIIQRADFLLKYANLHKLAFSPNGEYLCFCASAGLILWKKAGEKFDIIYTDTADVFADVVDFCFNSRSNKLFYISKDKRLSALDLNNNPHKKVSNLSLVPYSIVDAGEKLVISEEGNIYQILGDSGLEYKFLCLDLDKNDWQISLPNGYFFGSKGQVTRLGYSIWPNYFSFDQFDLKYNRPDIVAAALNSKNQTMVDAYRSAYIKRLHNLGITDTTQTTPTHAPEADISNRPDIPYSQTQSTLQLHITGRSNSVRSRFNIWINQIPLYGFKGHLLELQANKMIDTTVNVQLSPGRNQIEASLTDSNNIESLRTPLFVQYTAKKAAKNKVYFVGIGVDRFHDSTHDLKWCENDVRDLGKAIKSKIGDNCEIDTLFNKAFSTGELTELKHKLLGSTPDDEVIVLYSGHGLLSRQHDYFLSTYDIDFDSPETHGIPYDRLEGLLDSIPARRKLLLVDACHSGELDKDVDTISSGTGVKSVYISGKKGTTVENRDSVHLGLSKSFELMQELFVGITKNTGATIISAAAGTQVAYERDNLRNGLFTHSILEFMNSNKTATVSELKEYVNRTVAELSDGKQVPTSRTETALFDWKVF